MLLIIPSVDSVDSIAVLVLCSFPLKDSILPFLAVDMKVPYMEVNVVVVVVSHLS